MAFRRGIVRDVHSVVQSGGDYPGVVAVGDKFGHLAVSVDRPVPRRERLFLHPELPDGGGRHQLRPDRDDTHRQVHPQPFVYDAGTDSDRRFRRPGLPAHPIILR